MESNSVRNIVELLVSNGITLFVENDEIKLKKKLNHQLSEDIITVIKSNKKELISFLKSQKRNPFRRIKTVSDYGLPATISNKEVNEFLELPVHQNKVVDVHALTPLQKGFLYHNIYDNNESAYVCQFYCDLKGEISRKDFERAWKYLMQKHTVLRTAAFVKGLDIPVQCVYDEVACPIHELDYSKLDVKGVKVKFENFLKEDLEKGFSLEEAPLFRINLINLGGGHMRFVFTHHHIILDGWSVQNLMKDFHTLYSQLISKKEIANLTLDNFGTHLQHLTTVNQTEGLSFWSTYLSNLSSPSYLPFINDISLRNKRFGNKKIEFTINGAIKEITKKYRITENTLIQGAWSYLLSKYTTNETVVFGNVISGRDLKHKGIESKVGLYMNTIPVCNTINEDDKVSDWLQELQKQHTITREEHGYFSLSNIESQSGINGSLFDTLLSFQNYIDVASSTANEELSMNNLKGDTNTNYTCTLDVYSLDDQLRIVLQYNDQLLSEDFVNKIKGHLKTLLESLLQGTEYVRDLQYLTKEEEKQVLIDFNDTKTNYKNKSVIDLFKEQVSLNPDAEALIFERERLTYQELDAKSTHLANKLLDLGITPGSVVGIRMTRSTEMIITMFSVLKAGAAYMFINGKLPASRVIHMMEETGSSHIITNIDECPVGLESYSLINAESVIGQEIENSSLNLSISPNDLAYIIYTSGSTGNPKGCMITHGNLYSYVFSSNKYFYENKPDEGNWALVNSMSFDMSVAPIFSSLTRGKKLFIGNEEKKLDQLLKESFEHPDVDTMMITPAHLTLLKGLHIENTNVRTIMCGGEQVLKSHFNLVKKIDPKINFFAVYGPTEATVICTAIEVFENDKKITIGKPMPNVKIRILDANHRLVPIGVVGEIYISGPGVSRGYIYNPELTQEQFVLIDNIRFYKTGDLAKWDFNGIIDFVGRTDDQVKIRGHRIQLKEIELALDSLKGIKQSLVIAHERGGDSKQLVGYFVSDHDIDNEVIQNHLETRLPEYMVPRVYVHLPFLPTTDSVKIDVKALPKPEIKNNYLAPTTQLEKKLVNIWEELLEEEKIGLNDNFYELGGDSIKAIQLVNRSKSQGIHLQVKDIFTHQTISKIVFHLKENSSSVIKETGVLDGEVGLHPIQKLFFKRSYKDINHSNQSVLLKLSKSVTRVMLEDAIKKLAEHYDSLRLSYKTEKGDGLFPKQNYGFFDPKVFSEKVSDLEKIDEISSGYQSSLNISEGDLIRCVLFKTTDDVVDNRLLIVIHHLAVDGVSWRILVEDLTKLLESKIQGTQASLPNKGTSYRQWVVKLREYARSSRLESEYSYWKKILSNYTPLPVDSTYNETITYQDTEVITQSLSTSLTKVLIHETYTMYKAKINDILLSALAMVMSKWIDKPKVVITLEGHGREELFDAVDINRTMGWFTTTYPICLNTQDIDDIGVLVADTKDMLQSIPNKGIGFNVLQFESKSEKIKSDLSMFYEDITFNYLGSFDNGLDSKMNGLIGLASEGSGLNVSNKNINPHRFIIDSMIKDGSLYLEWKYDAKRYKRETVKALVDTYMLALESILIGNTEFFNQKEIRSEEKEYKITML